jgi:deoxyribodipyrimidine photo-lyase
MSDTIIWLRRDLRTSDHPALVEAVREASAGRVLPLYVIDPALWDVAGAPRQAWLLRSLRRLDEDLDGALVVRRGRPQDVVAAVAAELGGRRGPVRVHVSADAGPYGRRRDDAVAKVLDRAGSALVRTGTPYAVGPGSVLKADGTPYQVFTPYARAWRAHGWPQPAPRPTRVTWARTVEGATWPHEPDLGVLELPEAGEAAARRRWLDFRDGALADYAQDRDRADRPGSSQLSAHLKFGEIHPRTLLADLAGAGADRFRTELAWREFYADVLWHRPESARDYYRPQLAAMTWSGAGPAYERHVQAWRTGCTGYPFVDAGMRQLLAEGWMHNRVRMVVASFLVKDLHVEWPVGARHFMRWLRDGDLASNSHGWQWAAGTGTDASPYVRIFNPVSQGRRFDPDGAYVRRYVPQLRHLAGAAVHEPWDAPDGYDEGYPERIVDHARERQVSLDRFERVRRG